MIPAIRACSHCGAAYHWQRSQSALRLTYCGILCEQADLGFSIDGLIRAEIMRPAPILVEAQHIIDAQEVEALAPLLFR